jgi:SAM-dependent methyltransferase
LTTPSFPPGFFDRADPTDDARFYEPTRLVTHIDDGAIAAVGELYRSLHVDGDVLDLMSSWISHFVDAPRSLVALGMNAAELDANPQATSWVVHDLNVDPAMPFADQSFDDVTCCVSVDYLVRPVEVFADVARVLRPGGRFVVTFANRCFPTKAIRGWLATGDRGHVEIVRAYFEASGAFGPPTDRRCTREGAPGDPLYAVWAPSAPTTRSFVSGSQPV